MKKLFVLALALTLTVGTCAFAQGMSGGSDSKKMSENPPLKTMAGTISADGTKFTPDKDKSKSWGIVNPEDVKGHEGHHVKLQAHVYADKNQIHVMKVDMISADKMGKK
ncbi:MAG TPA: hypothetical protein VFA60_05140 [Terriglobales bacterium]|nr:hypothetical protein [Terriglobales bacterium]